MMCSYVFLILLQSSFSMVFANTTSLYFGFIQVAKLTLAAMQPASQYALSKQTPCKLVFWLAQIISQYTELTKQVDSLNRSDFRFNTNPVQILMTTGLNLKARP